MVLLWRFSPWRPRLVYSTESLRTLGSFGGKTFVSQFLNYLTQNMDNLLVGKYLGSVALGVYSVAYTTMFLPVWRIAQPISEVMYSALARIQDDPDRLGATWVRGNQLLSAVNVPAFLGMAVVAPDFVPVVLGDRWHEAAPVLQLLCLAGAADTLQALNWSATQAIGKPGVMLRLRAVSTPLTLAAFAVGLHWGVVGVAGFFAAARAINLVISMVVTCRALEFPLLVAVRAEALVAALAAAMAGVVLVARIGLIHGHVPGGARLVLLIALGFGVYAGLAFWRVPTLTREVLSYAPGRSRA
jgi:O-antigen/teichoic acid export membrane protein